MKQSEVRKFLDQNVVGQLDSGLFFEASVKKRNGRPTVVETTEEDTIDSSAIKWLTPAQRYC